MIFEDTIENTENVIMIKKILYNLTQINKCEIILSEDSNRMSGFIWEISIGASIPEFFKSHIGVNFDFEPGYSSFMRKLESREIASSIEFNDNIRVDPYETVIINGWTDYIEDIELPFTASLLVKGLARKLYSREIAVRLPNLKISQVIAVSDKSILLAIEGTIKASFVLPMRTTTKTLNNGSEQQDEFCFNPSKAFYCIKKCFNHFNSTIN